MILISFLPTAVETQKPFDAMPVDPVDHYWTHGWRMMKKRIEMTNQVACHDLHCTTPAGLGNDSSSCKVRQALQDTPGLLLLASTWHNGGNLIEVYTVYITFRSNNKKALQWGAAGKSKFSTLLDAVSTLWSSDHMYGIHVDAMKV